MINQICVGVIETNYIVIFIYWQEACANAVCVAYHLNLSYNYAVCVIIINVLLFIRAKCKEIRTGFYCLVI